MSQLSMLSVSTTVCQHDIQFLYLCCTVQMASVKVKLLTPVREQRRRDGSVQHCFTAITAESQLAVCFVKSDVRFEQHRYYVILGARTYTANDIMYIEILKETKVSIMLCTFITLLLQVNVHKCLSLMCTWK